MNRDETIELFLKGREAWNAWAEALLAERKAMEAAGTWKSRRELSWEREQGENPETQAWLNKAFADFSRCLFLVRGAGTKETAGEDKKEDASSGSPVKSIQLEADSIDFSRFIFPSDAWFGSATFTGDARFESATFTGTAWFGSATFTGTAGFESATFTGNAWFGSATFTGDARFESATFTGTAWFGSATFTGDARFESATFTGNARFGSATFTGNAWFGSATFTGDARFGSATFTGNAGFESATFTGTAWFESATFTGTAGFESATFTGTAGFESATFTGNAWFGSATFTGDARFESATFTGTAWFGSATFTGDARFESATFTGTAWFESATFTGDAWFILAKFQSYATFGGAHFEAEASFNAIRGERGFAMANATFEGVPDFIQAHFEEAPRLDDLKVLGRWIERHPRPPERKVAEKKPEKETPWQARRRKAARALTAGWYAARYFGARLRTWPLRAAKGGWRRLWDDNSGFPARWRALKRLAIDGHDSERELEYHARELQAQRFESDWPLPVTWRVWNPAAWVGAAAGCLRFWFGLAYGGLSDFGRSIVRPLVLWWVTIAVFAGIFLSGQPGAVGPWQGAFSAAAYSDYAKQVWTAPPVCHKGEALPAAGQLAPGKLYGLDVPVAGSTTALNEAFLLAIRNGSIFLDGGDDSARRSFGCLYGIQVYGGSPAPFVPAFVTLASGIQKLLSALYIFLFGLALRNMLKMK